MFNKLVHYFLYHRLITFIFLIAVLVLGVSFAPFNWKTGLIPRDPVPVDAIPDIGDNQQIVATEWMGRSPKDIQEQITYPLTTSLLGIPNLYRLILIPNNSSRLGKTLISLSVSVLAIK